MHLHGHQSVIYVAGHRGLVGAALVQQLAAEGYPNVVTATRNELDLRDRRRTKEFFSRTNPEFVVLAAARVGGILANESRPADFISDNLLIQTNVILSAFESGVKRLIFLGSSCVYPRRAPQPIEEKDLLTGPLEPTNQWYAVAKIAGIKLCQALAIQHDADMITLMPTNLYGPGDNFDLDTGHVLPALVRKFHESKVRGTPAVTVWGSGEPRREFLHSADMADAILHVLRCGSEEIVAAAPDRVLNVGTGDDISIADLAVAIRETVGCEAEIVFDRSKPDGTPRKLLNTSRMSALGWKARTGLDDGLRRTYDWFRNRDIADQASILEEAV